MPNVFHMDSNNLERSAEIIRVLAHPIRLQIAHELLMKKTLHVSALQQLLNLRNLQFHNISIK
ncbi:hypothetical protein [Bacillus cereus]